MECRVSELECSLFKMGRMGVLEEMNVYLKSMFCVKKSISGLQGVRIRV